MLQRYLYLRVMRRMLYTVLAGLLIVVFGIVGMGNWIYNHPDSIGKIANRIVLEWVNDNPLEDGVEVSWKGIHWMPWTGLKVDEIRLVEDQEGLFLYGITFSGTSYISEHLTFDSVTWDSLVVIGYPDSRWLHWLDPWFPEDASNALTWEAMKVAGRVVFKPEQGMRPFFANIDLSNVGSFGVKAVDAQISTPLKGLDSLTVNAKESDISRTWNMDLSTRNWNGVCQATWTEKGPIIQWDIVGSRWEGIGSGVLIGDTTYSHWNLASTEVSWRDRSWKAEGRWSNDIWSLKVNEEQDGDVRAEIEAEGSGLAVSAKLFLNDWCGEVLDEHLSLLRITGLINAEVDLLDSLTYAWHGEGREVQWDSQPIKSWSGSGSGGLSSLAFTFSSVSPHVKKLTASSNFKSKNATFEWAWDESTTWIMDFGLPEKGKVRGSLSWANGGRAHIENAIDDGYSPLFLDWQQNAQGMHLVDLRLGKYFLQLESGKSPLDWEMQSLNVDRHNMVNSWLEGKFNWPSKQRIVSAQLASPSFRVNYKQNKDNQWIKAAGTLDSLNWTLESTTALNSPRPVETLAKLENGDLAANIRWYGHSNRKDKITVSVSSSDLGIKGKVEGDMDRMDRIWTFKVGPNTLSLGSNPGNLDIGSRLLFNIVENSIELPRPMLWSGSPGRILIKGSYVPSGKDQISVEWEDLPVSAGMSLMGYSHIPLSGLVSGQATLKSENNQSIVESKLWVPQLLIDSSLLGQVEAAYITNLTNGFTEVQGTIGWPDEISPYITLRGERNPNWEIETDIDRFPLNKLEEWTDPTVKDISGTLNGEFLIREVNRRFVAFGNGRMAEMAFTLPKTGVRYLGEPKLSVRNNTIQISGELVDSKSTGRIDFIGNIDLTRPKGEWVDVEFESMAFLALDLSEGEDFYGHVRAQGSGSLTGGTDGMRLEIDASPLDSSVFILPFDAPITLENAGFLSFRKRESNSLGLMTTESSDDFKFDFNLNAHVNSNILGRIILDETVGDILEGTGEGNLRVSYPNNGDLNITGDIYIDHGTYLFTLENLLNKPFDVESGGRLSWTGDPYHVLADLTAVYKTKTNPGSYLGIPHQERIPVDVKLHVTGDLFLPELGFDIELPSAGSALQASLQSRLENSDELTTQVLSLLTLHSFWHQHQDWSNAGMSALETNTTQVLAQQFSNFMSQGLGNNWDIQLAYSKDAQNVRRQMDANIGRSFFNDRLTLKTELGIPMGSVQSSIGLGDVNIEYRLTEDRRWIAHAYSIRNTEMALSGQPVSQKQGVGLQLQWQGNKWKELWKALRTNQ